MDLLINGVGINGISSDQLWKNWRLQVRGLNSVYSVYNDNLVRCIGFTRSIHVIHCIYILGISYKKWISVNWLRITPSGSVCKWL